MNFQETTFGIRANAKGFRLLTDNIYKDKILAVVREYAHNARDAHIAAGCPDKPIRVHLPTPDHPYFIVSDDGIGMDDEAVRAVFTVFFESTKARHSNSMVGQLGIGGKAAFGYTDKFTVISRLNGTKSTYFMYIDTIGEYKVSPPMCTATDEPNGIDIIVEVKGHDIDKFVKAAAQAFEFFEPHPVITGNKTYKRQKAEYAFRGNGFALREYSYRSMARAIMGMIAYPIDPDVLHSFPEGLHKLAGYNLDIEFELGTMDFSPGREELNYDPLLTLPNLRKRIMEVKNELTERIDAEFRDCTSLRDAHERYLSIMLGSREPLGSYSRVLLNDFGARWNGRHIRSGNRRLVTNSLNAYEFVTRGKGVVSVTAQKGVPIYPNTTIFFGSGKRNERAIVRDYIEAQRLCPRNVVLISGEEELLSRIAAELDGWTIRRVTELPRREVRNVRRASFKVLKGAIFAGTPIESMVETQVDLDQGGYYVLMRHQTFLDECGAANVNFTEQYNTAYNVGLIDENETIVFVPSTMSGQVLGNDKWKPFHAELKRRVMEKVAEPETTKLLGMWFEWDALIRRNGISANFRSGLASIAQFFSNDHIIGRLKENLEELEKSRIAAQQRYGLVVAFDIDYEQPVSRRLIENDVETIKERYPLLDRLFMWETDQYKIAEYVKLVDFAKEHGW